MKKIANEKNIIWLIYISLLAVLLPHTAWAFAKFEPAGNQLVAWLAAFTFEAAIATFTHKLANHIEQAKRYKSILKRFSVWYLNSYGFGLFTALLVSFAANFSHAVEFGGQMEIFARYSVPFGVYALAFGGILPGASLLFARVLSNVQETEHVDDVRLTMANKTITDLRRQLKATEQERIQTEQRLNALGDVVVQLFGENKRDRILAARQQWPQLPMRSVAIITDASPAYVSETLNGKAGEA